MNGKIDIHLETIFNQNQDSKKIIKNDKNEPTREDARIGTLIFEVYHKSAWNRIGLENGYFKVELFMSDCKLDRKGETISERLQKASSSSFYIAKISCVEKKIGMFVRNKLYNFL